MNLNDLSFLVWCAQVQNRCDGVEASNGEKAAAERLRKKNLLYKIPSGRYGITFTGEVAIFRLVDLLKDPGL